MSIIRTVVGLALVLAAAGTPVIGQSAPVRTEPGVAPTLKVTAFHLRNANTGLGWTESGFIFYVDDADGISHETFPSCPATSFFFVPKTDPANAAAENPLYKDYLAAVIAANALNRRLAVWWDGCVTVSGTTYLKVVGLNVLN